MAKEIEISGRRVAVTGAGGFIGNALCRRLVEEGVEVAGIEVRAEAEAQVRDAGADFVMADITGRAAIGAALEGAELVFHTAAIVSDYGAMDDFVRVNVGGTANVLDAAEAAGAERVLHLSSVVVYGYDDPQVQDESAFRRACGIPYIDTKSASDRLACERGAVVIRPGDVYGPGSIWAVRPLQMAQAGQLSVGGDGNAQMLPVYLDDLVESVILGLRRGRPGEAYTVWDDSEAVTFEDYFNAIAEIAGAKPARRLPRPLLQGLALASEGVAALTRRPPLVTRNGLVLTDRRGSVSAAKAREQLGWQPQVNLEEGLRRTADWFRAEGLLWDRKATG